MRFAKSVGLGLLALAGFVSAADARQPRSDRGGFYNDVYRDGRCWFGGYYQCGLHGRYDGAPYNYHFAIYRGCYQHRRVETPHGVRVRRVFVCPTIQ